MYLFSFQFKFVRIFKDLKTIEQNPITRILFSERLIAIKDHMSYSGRKGVTLATGCNKK